MISARQNEDLVSSTNHFDNKNKRLFIIEISKIFERNSGEAW